MESESKFYNRIGIVKGYVGGIFHNCFVITTVRELSESQILWSEVVWLNINLQKLQINGWKLQRYK